MWTIEFRGPESLPHRLIVVLDETGVLRWSGQSLLSAFRFLAEWGQVAVVLDVDSAIWFLGPAEAI